MRTPLYWVFNCLWIFCGVVKIAEAEIIALVPSFMWTPSFWSWNCSRLSWRIDFHWLLEIESAIFFNRPLMDTRCFAFVEVRCDGRSVRFVTWLVVLEPQWLSGDVIARGPISLFFTISMEESCDKFSWISLF